MNNTLYTIKKELSQTWDSNGKRLPVTILQVPDLQVVQVKTSEKEGYDAIQVGYGEQKAKRLTKPMRKHLGVSEKGTATRHLKEILVDTSGETEVPKKGETITQIENVSLGDIVNATGITKGTGFTGVVKRWGFAGGPKTHGQSDRERAPGSIGQGTTPGRVWKGKKMAGRDGGLKVTQQKLMIVNIDKAKNEIWIKGTTPGHRGSLITLKKVNTKEFKGLHATLRPKAEEVTTEDTNKENTEDKS